jgi:glycosyltransferase involved in cell wall biosynthesis
LAEPFDPENMANALRWVLEDTNRWQQLRDAARRRAENLWNPRRICEMYQALYNTMLSKPFNSNLIE